MTAVVHPRLVRIDVLPHPDGGVVITTPRGKNLRVHLEADELNDVLAACDGRTALKEIAAGHPRAADLLALLERLQDEGCLTAIASSTPQDWVRFAPAVETPDRPSSTAVVVVGSGRLADLAIRLLHGPAGERFANVYRDDVPTSGEVVTLVFADSLDHKLLTAVDESRGVWSYLCIDQQVARFGPHITPGSGPSYGDLHARKLAAAAQPDVVRARERRQPGADDYLPPEAELTWILSTYLVDVERWLAGGPALGLWHEVTLDRPAWLPASLVYVNWYNTPYGAADPATNGPYYAGIAAGQSHQHAVGSGLLEIIERHATMVWWLNRQPLPALDPGSLLSSVWSGPLDGRLIAIDNEFGVPVLAGVVEDVERQILTLGFAARTDPAEAALKAWAEGVVLQEISRDLLRETSAYGAEIERGRLPDQGLKPWRADRRYLDDYRPDFRDVITLLCQSQVHLDARAVDRVRPRVDVPVGRKLSEVPALDGPVQTAVETAGYEVFAADITTPDIAAAGLSVVRTVVPGTIGNFEAAFPYLGKRVAQDSAVRLGWRTEPLAEADLTRIPIPHA